MFSGEIAHRLFWVPDKMMFDLHIVEIHPDLVIRLEIPSVFVIEKRKLSTTIS